MIYILKVGEGEYDSYCEVTVAVFRGRKGHDLDKLRNEFYRDVATPANAEYQKTRKKGMPRHLRMGMKEFLTWLQLAKGFRLVKEYVECCL